MEATTGHAMVLLCQLTTQIDVLFVVGDRRVATAGGVQHATLIINTTALITTQHFKETVLVQLSTSAIVVVI